MLELEHELLTISNAYKMGMMINLGDVVIDSAVLRILLSIADFRL